MKNSLWILFASLIFFSCEEFSNPDINELPQQWILKGYKSSWVAQDDLTPITDSTYYYNLNVDGSFVKTIGKYSLTGTYDFYTYEGRNYVSLDYDEESFALSEEWGSWGLIHYCGQDHEIFTVLSSKTIHGNWGSCDGPILYFDRK